MKTQCTLAELIDDAGVYPQRLCAHAGAWSDEQFGCVLNFVRQLLYFPRFEEIAVARFSRALVPAGAQLHIFPSVVDAAQSTLRRHIPANATTLQAVVVGGQQHVFSAILAFNAGGSGRRMTRSAWTQATRAKGGGAKGDEMLFAHLCVDLTRLPSLPAQFEDSFYGCLKWASPQARLADVLPRLGDGVLGLVTLAHLWTVACERVRSGAVAGGAQERRLMAEAMGVNCA